MKTVRVAFLIALAAVTAASVRGEEKEEVKRDLDRLQGEWSMVSGAADGQPMPDQLLTQMKRICKRDETTTTMAGRVFFKAKITLDPSKTPKTIDYEMTEGFTKGKKQLGVGRSLVIYYDPQRPEESVLGDPKPMLRNETISVLLAAFGVPTFIVVGWAWRVSREHQDQCAAAPL